MLDTALRESTEEIGLSPEAIEILGELDDKVSHTAKYVISPFVGLIRYPCQFQLDGEETEEAFEVPLSALMGKGYPAEKAMDGKKVNSIFYDYQGRVIWGATARILKQFLEIYAQAI